MKQEDNPTPSETGKPKRKIIQTVIASVLIGAAVLWIAGAIATESTDGPSFLNNPTYTDENGPVNKSGYDLSHPLGFITNLENNPIEPDVVVPSTYTATIDKTAQTALDQIINKKYSATDYPSPNAAFTISEALFQAANNGTTVSDSQLSSLLNSAVKPFDESTLTADVSILFPIGTPGNQIITVDKIAHTDRGYNLYGVIGPGESVDWETTLTVPNKDSELIMPLDAKVYRIAPLGSNLLDAALICFTGPDGTSYELLIDEEDELDLGAKNLPFSPESILPAMADAPEIDYTYTPFSIDTGIEGKVLPAGTPILKTVNNNAKINFSLRCEIKNGFPFPDFNFISSAGKLVYIP